MAEALSESTRGKVRLEDAGFDWKILGPDSPSPEEFEYVAWQSDQDAYAASGQKCSAQSILFAHETWTNRGIFDRLASLAANRKLSDLTISPTLSHTTEQILQHTDRLLGIPGARLAFGGKELKDHTVPACYGAVEPTAVFVPLNELLKPEHFQTCCTEIFAPFQVFTEFNDGTEAQVLEACERMSHHLTAAVVSNDARFQNRVLGSTVNGTTYTGMRARTTGAPQNHWFGPAVSGVGRAHCLFGVDGCVCAYLAAGNR